MEKLLDFISSLPFGLLVFVGVMYVVLMLSSVLASFVFQHSGKIKQRNIFIAISLVMIAVITVALFLLVITMFDTFA